nr:hypothetical protein [Ktedonobacteraceae bacterium]
MRNLQRVVTIGCVCIGVLVLVGTVSAMFSPGLQAALTVPLIHRTMPTMGTKNMMGSGAGTTPIIQATATAGVIPLPTQVTMTMMSTTFLAQDTFQRMDQRFWGKASDGQMWQGNANSSQNFTIAGHTGLVSHGQGAFEAILGPRVTDAEVMCSGVVSLFSNGATNMGLVLRWMDSNNWYKAYIDGNQLSLLKRVAGVTTVLKAVAFPALSGKSYTLRFRAVGSMLAAKVWPTGQAEPAMWMVTATDTTFLSGFGGLRLLLQNNVVAQMTLFTEQAVAKNTP